MQLLLDFFLRERHIPLILRLCRLQLVNPGRQASLLLMMNWLLSVRLEEMLSPSIASVYAFAAPFPFFGRPLAAKHITDSAVVRRRLDRRVFRRAKFLALDTPSGDKPGDQNTMTPYEFVADEIVVRFINTPDGREVITSAPAGENLLRVGDRAGVHISRGCQSGLCGSCTTDLVDTNFDGGVQVVRACQTSVFSLHGESEMVVDVHRIKDFKKSETMDPMARFANLDTDYVPGAVPRRAGAKRMRECSNCSATGDIKCYGCDGEGESSQDTLQECALCLGTGMIRCATCQGTGMTMR